MNRPLLRLALAALLTLLGLGAAAGTALAAPANVDKFETFAFDFNACNGEFVTAEGKAHVVSKTSPDGSSTFKLSFNGQGTGDQGNDYVINANETVKFSATSSEERITFRTISKGGDPNQVTTLVFIVHPDGTFEFSNTADCRG